MLTGKCNIATESGVRELAWYCGSWNTYYRAHSGRI